MASSSSTTSSSWASTSSSPDRHLLLENSPSTVQDWPSLSFLEDDLEENAEIIQNTRKFDPVVGARNSTTSTASVRSGSSGFFDALEVSPSSSVSPIVQEPHHHQHHQGDENLSQVMTNLYQLSLVEEKQVNFNNQQAMANLAALAQITQMQQQPDQLPPMMSFDHFGGFNSVIKQSPMMGGPPSSYDGGFNPELTGPVTPPKDEHDQMQIRCKFGALGEFRGQFNSPHGFCMGLHEEIIVADTYNHRIQVFDKSGTFKFAFGVAGKEEGLMWFPRKVAVLKNSGNFVVCDRGSERSRMQIFSMYGHFIRRIPIRFIDIVAGLAISKDGHIVAVDSVTPTIFVLSESGELLKYIECAEHMSEPSDIAIFGNEYYICDFKGHSVVVFHENGRFLRRIGSEPVTTFPNGIDISDAGDILVGDSHGNQFHVAVYDRRGELISQFQCPQVKVSRCCGLKITSEGYVVTLAKNNHHVLVLNTLYVP